MSGRGSSSYRQLKFKKEEKFEVLRFGGSRTQVSRDVGGTKIRISTVQSSTSLVCAARRLSYWNTAEDCIAVYSWERLNLNAFDLEVTRSSIVE